MNGSKLIWLTAQRARRLENWAPRLMMAEARMRAMIEAMRTTPR
ncbi:MAG: hypothetical protein ACJAVR_001059 [Paracoccaceae bacterium]|jgi:hypothetical protein